MLPIFFRAQAVEEALRKDRDCPVEKETPKKEKGGGKRPCRFAFQSNQPTYPFSHPLRLFQNLPHSNFHEKFASYVNPLHPMLWNFTIFVVVRLFSHFRVYLFSFFFLPTITFPHPSTRSSAHCLHEAAACDCRFGSVFFDRFFYPSHSSSSDPLLLQRTMTSGNCLGFPAIPAKYAEISTTNIRF